MSEAAVELVNALRNIPRELRPRVRPALVKAARPILADAQRRASWSSRIPRSLSLRVQLAGQNPRVSIVARSAVAPHARPFEGLQRGATAGKFRHPIFGRSQWVDQRTRPFLTPAVQENRDEIVDALTDALHASARAAGWRG